MTGTPPALIEVEGLKKSFEGVNAVRGVSFVVPSGEIFGLLGPNGAGKTTTINLLTGLSRPDAGAIRIAGRDCVKQIKAAQDLIGVVPDESNLYPELSGFENLCFCAALYGIRKKERQARAGMLLDEFGLGEVGDRKFAAYSRGMKRKLTIAAALIHKPQILFLDEPTSGIDLATARQIRQRIANLRNEGTTVFLTTHYIEEAERLCERIAFLVRGKIVRLDTLQNFLNPVRDRHFLALTLSQPDQDLGGKLAGVFRSLNCQEVSPTELRLESVDPVPLAEVVAFCQSEGAEVYEARRLNPSLEEVFVEITGIESNTLREENQGRGSMA